MMTDETVPLAGLLAVLARRSISSGSESVTRYAAGRGRSPTDERLASRGICHAIRLGDTPFSPLHGSRPAQI